jgi:hypothetical protein
MLVYGPLAPIFFLFCILYFVISFLIDKFFIMFLYEKSHDSDGRILNDIADQVSYYLGVSPFYILAMLPTLMSLAKTWLLYIPFMCMVYLLIRYIKNKSQKEDDKAIIIGLREQQRNLEITETEHVQQSTEFENDIEKALEERTSEQTRPSTQTRSKGFFSNLVSNLRGKNTETQFSTADIENLGVDVRKLAQRYRHPYLRHLQQKKTPKVQDQNSRT